MQKKVVKGILNKKFKNWIKSIKDENVRNLVYNNSIITGGAIASLIQNEEVNDFDIYFTNKETTRAVAGYYAREFEKRKGWDKGSIKEIQDDIREEESDYIKNRLYSNVIDKILRMSVKGFAEFYKEYIMKDLKF